ncbi:hypothetical protein SAMN05444169_3690 [Bradyrhizobium erythrophlei]|uniref:Bacteriocin-protection, YdeI or OmpD-Associated n=1 Tax=Bradyrhizobium erythrophlei TaxID=1437360 RepID=A0A1M5LWC7_9BRAD|nr:hypothetical protein SAMN05444169_3690 [Bradyrhizobium erythrophlei]
MAKAKRDLPVVAFKSQQAWDSWLTSQPADSNGLWLKLAKKSSGIASVSKPEAIDTALCHGWIDGQLDSFDDDYWLIRFTPRQSTSKWSEKNRTRALELVKLRRMKPPGSNEIERVRRTAAGTPPMRRKARRRCRTISVLPLRETRKQEASSKRSTAPIATRSFTGSAALKRPRPGWHASRNSSRCSSRAELSIRQSPEREPSLAGQTRSARRPLGPRGAEKSPDFLVISGLWG